MSLTQTERWTDLLKSAIRDSAELLELLELARADLPDTVIVDPRFPVLVPRGYAARMRKRDARDPLLRQVLPIARERDRVPGFARDPLDELARANDGLMRKYAGRALLIATAACPVHCRYCFRRHFPYTDRAVSKSTWTRALGALAQAPEISEVILSGGDPLSLSNRRLSALIEDLERIEHIEILRIHSRYPIVLPERIDAGFLAALASCRFKTVVVVHCNHAQEIDRSVENALGSLRARGVILLNQSVLLLGVNDDLAVLCALSRRLLDAGVLPYYLHTLDHVEGSAHFDVSEARALELVAGMRRALPGYLVPRLVRERAGELSKSVLA